MIRIDAARFQAPQTDMTVSGTADISSASPLNLHLNGEVNLAMVRNFVPDLASSGSITVIGTVRGSFATPDLSGRASIRGGEFHYADFTNGLTNATGEIIFSGTRAVIQSFSADTGGGKFTGSGSATLMAGALFLSVLGSNERRSPALSAGYQLDLGFRYPDCAELAAQTVSQGPSRSGGWCSIRRPTRPERWPISLIMCPHRRREITRWPI